MSSPNDLQLSTNLSAALFAVLTKIVSAHIASHTNQLHAELNQLKQSVQALQSNELRIITKLTRLEELEKAAFAPRSDREAPTQSLNVAVVRRQNQISNVPPSVPSPDLTVQETQIEADHNRNSNSAAAANNNNRKKPANVYQLTEIDIDVNHEEIGDHHAVSHRTPPRGEHKSKSPSLNLSASPRMPPLERGTEDDASHRTTTLLRKENIPPTQREDDEDNDICINTESRAQNALQLLGLQSADSTLERTDTVASKEENDESECDLVVLFSSFECSSNFANQAMKNSDFEAALSHIRDAMDELHKYVPDMYTLSTQQKHIIAAALCNRAICFGKLRKYEEALSAIDESLSLRPDWFKLHSTKAALYAFRINFDAAIHAYRRAIELCDENDLENRHKLQKRYNRVIEKKNAKKRSREEIDRDPNHNDQEIEESPAKRVKYNTQEKAQRLRQALSEKTVTELGVMLQRNEQTKSGRKQELVEKCVDGILFGAIPKCPQCQKAGLKYDRVNGSYTCPGNYDVKLRRKVDCDFFSSNVQRKPWVGAMLLLSD